MEKIKIGITQGDINGTGSVEVLKAFSNPTMFELCTPVLYGSSKAVGFYRKQLDLQVPTSDVPAAEDAVDDKLNVVDCGDEETKADPSVPSTDAAKLAWTAIEQAVREYTDGQTDAVVTLPVNYDMMKQAGTEFIGNLDYMEKVTSMQGHGLQMLVGEDLRMAIALPGIPMKNVPAALTAEIVGERLRTLDKTLKIDFCIDAPRIAVMALNTGAEGQAAPGTEEKEAIAPAIEKAVADDIVCYGPYTADWLAENGNFAHFDAILTIYYDQAIGLFKALTQDEGVAFCAGLPIVCTTPAHGVGYDKMSDADDVSEQAFCHAVYLATDIQRNRIRYSQASANKLRKQYNERRDDSDKLKQLSVPDDDDIL